MKTAALVLFIIMYVIMIALPKFRPHAALGTGLIYLILGILPFSQIPLIINWNVLMTGLHGGRHSLDLLDDVHELVQTRLFRFH